MAAIKSKKPTKSPSKKLKISQKKKTNRWLVVGGVAAVAIAGAVIVRFSGASQYVFVKYVRNMSNPYTKLTTFNYDSRTYARTLQGQSIRTLISAREMNMATSLCAHVANSSAGTTTFTIEQMVAGTRGDLKVVARKSTKVGPRSTGNVCVRKASNSNTVIQLYQGNKSSGIGVDTFYSRFL